MTKRMVVDMDVGIDDALAIMFLAGQQDAEIVAVGSVHGNVDAPHGRDGLGDMYSPPEGIGSDEDQVEVAIANLRHSERAARRSNAARGVDA